MIFGWPREERVLDFDILWGDAATRHQAILTASDWNAATRQAAAPSAPATGLLPEASEESSR